MKYALALLKRRVVTLLVILILLCATALLLQERGSVAAMRADAIAAIRFPILMYHSVLRDPQRARPLCGFPSAA